MSFQYIQVSTPDGDTLTFAVPREELPTVVSSWQRRGAKVSLGARTTPFSAGALSGADIRQPFRPTISPDRIVDRIRPPVDRPNSRQIAAAVQKTLPPSPTPKDISVELTNLNVDETEVSESDYDALLTEEPLDDDGGD